MGPDLGARLQGKADGYLVEAILGQGGFGITYRCRRERDGLAVMAKVLRMDRLAEWKSLELFEREARVLRHLHHDNIPDYVDDFALGDPEVPSGLVLIQELVDGVDLARRARGGQRFDQATMVDWFGQILEVLTYLHALSPPVIHRDISPKNIVLRDDGRAFLVDFGSVQAALRDSSSLAETSAGTFGYAPPEQFLGRASPASDLYGLAMTYLAVATGAEPEQLPIEGIRVDVREALRHDARLTLLLEAMTEPDPRQRLDDAGEALRRIEPLLPGRSPTPSDRRGDVVTSESDDRPSKGKPKPAVRPLRVSSVSATRDAKDDDARGDELDPALHFPPETWIEAEARLSTLDHPWPSPDPPKFTDIPWAGLSLDGQRLVLGGDKWLLSITLDDPQPTAQRLDLEPPPEDLWVASLDGSPRWRLRRPDGALVAIGENNWIRLRQDGQSGRGETLQADCTRGLRFSPDGAELIAVGSSRLAVFRSDGEVERMDGTGFDYRPDGLVWARARGQQLWIEPPAHQVDFDKPVTGLRFSPDGQRLAVALGQAEELLILEVAGDGSITGSHPVEPPTGESFALLGFAADGGRLLGFTKPRAGSGRSAVLVWATSGALLGAIHLAKGEPRPIFLTPHGFYAALFGGHATTSPWSTLGVARRALVEGRVDTELLDATARAGFEDYQLRVAFVRQAMPRRGRKPHRQLVDASAGLSHLLPQVWADARGLAAAQPGFVQGGSDRSRLESTVAACRGLKARSPDERRVLFEEMQRRLDADRAAAETARRAAEARRAAADQTEPQPRAASTEREAASHAEEDERHADQRAHRAAKPNSRRSGDDDPGTQGATPGRVHDDHDQKRFHRGLQVAAGLFALTLGITGYGISLVAASDPDYRPLSGLFFGLAGVLLIGLLVFGFHDRCPSCRGLFARRVLTKRFSHTSPDQRRIYAGDFRCRRCGHHWSGYV